MAQTKFLDTPLLDRLTTKTVFSAAATIATMWIVAPGVYGSSYMAATAVIFGISSVINLAYSTMTKESSKHTFRSFALAVAAPVVIGFGLWAMGCFPLQYYSNMPPGVDGTTGGPQFKLL